MKMNLIALTLLFGCSPFRQVGDQDKPVLKVFLLAGQSNMEGHAEVATLNKTTGLPKNVRGVPNG